MFIRWTRECFGARAEASDSCQHHAKLLGRSWTRIADNARNQEVTSFYPCRYLESIMDESGLVKSRFLPVWMLFFLDFGTKIA